MDVAKRPILDAARLADLRDWAEDTADGLAVLSELFAENGGDTRSAAAKSLSDKLPCILALIDLAEQREWHDPDMVRPTEYRGLDVEIELRNDCIVRGDYCGDGLWRSRDGRNFWHSEVRRWRELP